MGEAFELRQTDLDASTQSLTLTRIDSETALRMEKKIADLVRVSPNAPRDIASSMHDIAELLMPHETTRQAYFLQNIGLAKIHALELLADRPHDKLGFGTISEVCRIAIIDLLPDLARDIDSIMADLQSNPHQLHGRQYAELVMDPAAFANEARNRVVKALLKKVSNNTIYQQFDAALQINSTKLKQIIMGADADISDMLIEMRPIRTAIPRIMASPHARPQQLSLGL